MTWFLAIQHRQQQPTRKVRRFLGLGLMLLCVGPLASCQTLSSSLSESLTGWEPMAESGIAVAQAAETDESPAAIAQEIERLNQEIAAATESEKNWGSLHYERAYYHHISDNFEAAIADYDIAVAAYGDRDAQLYADRGLAHEALAQVSRTDDSLADDVLLHSAAAITDYTKAIAINQAWGDEEGALALTYAWRGDVHEFLDNEDAALADYNTAIALAPEMGGTFYDRAALHHEQGNLSQAIQDFTSYIQLTAEPGSWAYYSRGLVYEESGRGSQALADYSEAIALNDWGNGDPELDQKDQADAYFARAWLHHDLGNYRRAIRNYSESLQLNPIDSLTLYNRGLAQEENGNLEQALADYSSAIELNKNWGRIDLEGERKKARSS